ncbi:hypothetical protein [Rhodococcus pyridinivorans]|uniref:hypothetical protein n=1 Tax=Rhodococcus pyridinivorans TaxID=103816 RepID=UPI0022838A94|nr:hypothetical protein [Rhodococcus pyridinivorans]WAL49739.1 hypothetical protein OQN32_27390 [Rhodococcus pyridinivorans]
MPMPQLIALVIFLLALGVVLMLIFWPFVMAQNFFLLTQGIDKYTALPLTVGIAAQLLYWGAIIGVIACLASKPSLTGDSDTAVERRRYRKRLTLSGGVLIGVVALLVWGFWVPEKSGGEHYQVIKDRCRSEVGSAGEITYSLVDDCIERKIDSL